MEILRGWWHLETWPTTVGWRIVFWHIKIQRSITCKFRFETCVPYKITCQTIVTSVLNVKVIIYLHYWITVLWTTWGKLGLTIWAFVGMSLCNFSGSLTLFRHHNNVPKLKQINILFFIFITMPKKLIKPSISSENKYGKWHFFVKRRFCKVGRSVEFDKLQILDVFFNYVKHCTLSMGR